MILFDLIKETILEIQKFYGKTILKEYLTVSGKTIYFYYSSRLYTYGSFITYIGF